MPCLMGQARGEALTLACQGSASELVYFLQGRLVSVVRCIPRKRKWFMVSHGLYCSVSSKVGTLIARKKD